MTCYSIKNIILRSIKPLDVRIVEMKEMLAAVQWLAMERQFMLNSNRNQSQNKNKGGVSITSYRSIWIIYIQWVLTVVRRRKSSLLSDLTTNADQEFIQICSQLTSLTSTPKHNYLLAIYLAKYKEITAFLNGKWITIKCYRVTAERLWQ